MANQALDWEIKHEPHGLFVTCYRPIIIGVQVEGNYQPAHVRATLLIETGPGSGEYEDTGVQFDGYSQYSDSSDGYFVLNAADFCKYYFEDITSWYDGTYCGTWHKMIGRGFMLRINPAIFSPSGILNVDEEQTLESKPFIVVPLITKAGESTSFENDNIRLDKFVNNGENNSSAPLMDTELIKLTTNMPQYNTIDINSGQYFFMTLLYRGVPGRIAYLRVWNETTGNSEDYEALSNDSSYARHTYVNIFPPTLEYVLASNNNAFQSLLFNGLGDLTTDVMSVQLQYKNSSTYSLERYSPKMYYRLIDSSKSSCKQEHFVWRNMRGGFDWFIATGTQNKEVSVSGGEYDKHTDFNRNTKWGQTTDSMPFGTIRGQHASSSLWNTKKEVYTMFTQPVTRKYAEWLEELVVSPQAWVCREVEGWQDYMIAGMSSANGKMLLAINIIKGSYKMYSTEKNLHYVEFKYTLSENSLTQKL